MKTNHPPMPAMGTGFRIVAAAAWLTVAFGVARAQGPIAPGELVAPKIEISGGNVNLTVQPSVSGRNYQLQGTENLATGIWHDLGNVVTGNGNNLVITTPHLPGAPRRFYRLALDPASTVPEGFALIPAGAFLMGESNLLLGNSDERPVHSVYVSAFYMGKYEVTKEEWDLVWAWGANNGYTDLPMGNLPYASKGANHPVHSIDWYAMVKWCNARSQKEGLTLCYTAYGSPCKTGSGYEVRCNWNANGYRLPTEAEWEKAARGGVAGKIFPWGTDTISHSQANYYSNSSFDNPYDVSPTRGYHPTYAVGGSSHMPYSSPVGSFAPNRYGLYDMAGNMFERCWDEYSSGYYALSPATDPSGADGYTYRIIRGGSWSGDWIRARCAYRGWGEPGGAGYNIGFRVARGQAATFPAGFALIPAGEFLMGDQSNPLVGYSTELPVHPVFVSAFYMGKYEVAKEEWDAVRAWGLANGYTDLPAGGGKAANHPVHTVDWYDVVKWCNARSQKEGLTLCYTAYGSPCKTGSGYEVTCNWNANGYRLPTEAEWEKAARGGMSGKNFPWGDTISQSQANYNVYSSNGTTNYYSYDVTPRPPATGNYFYHPSYTAGGYPYSSPVGSFAPDGYGLYDMAGNMWEWCWDWHGSYAAGSQADPRGPATNSIRVFRGGSWHDSAYFARCASRNGLTPTHDLNRIGFRLARGQP